MANVGGEKQPAVSGPQTGLMGNLTDEYRNVLVKMWECYFNICDRARGQASKGVGFKEQQRVSNPKDSGIPEDDKAKDEMQHAQEQQGMVDLMEQYGPEALRDAWWSFVRGENPDGAMLRFIRARKGDVSRSLAMMATCLKWRLDSDIESLITNGDLENGKTIPKFTEQLQSGKIFAFGCTTKEQPICYVVMKHHNMWDQPAASMQKFTVMQLETFRVLMQPPQDKVTIFADLKGFGIKQMDLNLLYLAKILESYYPETVGTIYVLNAPWIFWGFWRAIKNLLDPVVRSKIKFITSAADTEGDIPQDRLITRCGGKVTSAFQYVDPIDGENELQENESEKARLLARHRVITAHFEEVTRAWCKTAGQDADLQERRDVLCKKLRLSQFELEPYIRGQTVYHRNGMLPRGNPGITVFDYDTPGKQPQKELLGLTTCRKSIEQQLYNIRKYKITVKEAEEITAQALRDDTWGDWQDNDNSEEIKTVALESLVDMNPYMQDCTE